MAKTVKKNAPLAGDNGQHIQDIAHEVVTEKTPGAVSAPAVIITTEDQIRMEVQKFNLADSAIAEMKKVYGALTIAGPDDKDGYKAVKEAWNETRSKRTGLEKKGLEIRAGYTVITKAVKKEEDRLIELITPLEEDLYSKWKAIDDEKERAKIEREKAEQAELMKRVEEVQTLGMTFADGFYVIGENISMDVATLRAMPEDQYEKLKGRIQTVAAEIKAEKDRQRQAELDRQAEIQRQQEQLKKEQDELRRQQEAMERERRDLENQRLEANRMRAEMRTSKAQGIGLRYDARDGAFVFDNGWNEPIRVPAVDVFAMDDAKFPTWLEGVADEIRTQNADLARHEDELKREAEALEIKKKFIADQMKIVGLSFSYTAQAFQWEDKNTAISVPFAELIPLTEAEITKRAQGVFDEIAAAKKQTKEHDEKIAEQQRKEQQAAMGDKDRMAALVSQLEQLIGTIYVDDYKTKKYQNAATKLKGELGAVLTTYKS
jgi:DNA repair exonuclease SbcCD ATPase subunit